jgi:hypothetical protein
VRGTLTRRRFACRFVGPSAGRCRVLLYRGSLLLCLSFLSGKEERAQGQGERYN